MLCCSYYLADHVHTKNVLAGPIGIIPPMHKTIQKYCEECVISYLVVIISNYSPFPSSVHIYNVLQFSSSFLLSMQKYHTYVW